MKDTIILHHTGNPHDRTQAKEVIALHQRKFGQKGAYHFLIEKSGSIVQFHPEDFIGYHAGNWTVNVRSIGICLAGDFTQQKSTSAQLDALTKLVTDLQTRWGISDERMFLHRDVKGTACPGIDLRALLLEHRVSLLKTKLTQLEKAEKRAKGNRKSMLQRLIARILKIIA